MRRQVLANEGKYLKETFSRKISKTKIWKNLQEDYNLSRTFEMRRKVSTKYHEGKYLNINISEKSYTILKIEKLTCF